MQKEKKTYTITGLCMNLEEFRKFTKQSFVEKLRIFHATLHFHAAHKLQHLMKANTNIKYTHAMEAKNVYFT